ncbi:MAG: bifunctional glycosyltransferase family 2 protein/CDP-glycerol:glycerophosphate glycerophosphotransferase [Oscillospiraceae bacterium]|nr:bifunctional glycosyltransferase family 2 protein/CDP-glycerol:glycerophosphate glycerophosphotransferase [Oscillospiraceae bacterium]
MKKITVIVPVYNVEQYLPDCLDSLANQTLPKEDMEVLLINDGSPDGSGAICERYAARYEWIRYFFKENEGLSATRNYGLARAQGKYIMYLDSDDTFTPETLEAVAEFFDTHYDEVDLVTYRIQPYRDGKKLRAHFRYRTLCKSGVYDLNEFPYITQTTINICVKNRGKDNILFSSDPNFRHEDQKYTTDHLMPKCRIGFCDKGEYSYNRGNSDSLTATRFYPYYIFESTTAWYEEMFALYSGKVPGFIQALLLHDLNWKLNGNILFPYHYDEARFAQAEERLRVLLRRVDTSLLIGHPTIQKHLKLYLLKFAGSAHISASIGERGICVSADGLTIDQNVMSVVLRRQRVKNGRLYFLGCIYTTYFTAAEDETPELFAEENGVLRPIEVFDSTYSFLHPMLRIGRIFAFRYNGDAAALQRLRFFVRARGMMVPATLLWQPYGGGKSRFKEIADGGFRILRGEKELHIRQTSTIRRRLMILRATLKYCRHPRLTLRRVAAALYDSPKRRIWLYYDLYTVEKDNAYFQFQNDFEKKDGIRRYYVINRKYKNIDKLFTKQQQKYLVKKGSVRHAVLYLCCERILTAFFGRTPTYPFQSGKEELLYEDITRFQTTYLQHGVLHAALHKANHAELARADQVVVSTPFEFENYQKRYGYTADQLLCTGMARYDQIDRGRAPERRILLAPSWRKYMTQQINPAHWEPVKRRIRDSEYYQGFIQFLEDPRLHRMLEEQDYYLDVKLHPILSNLKGLFEVSHPRITLLQEEPPPEQYKVFITDFSSYVFDFVYLNRCVQYFVPDEEKFRAGMNHYRSLDLPLEEAFGPVAYDAVTAVENLCKLAEADFVPELVYRERTKGFFYPLENCAEALYNALTTEKNKP